MTRVPARRAAWAASLTGTSPIAPQWVPLAGTLMPTIAPAWRSAVAIVSRWSKFSRVPWRGAIVVWSETLRNASPTADAAAMT